MMSQVLTQSTRTPCVGVCSTGIGDSVCRGCKRFVNEVVQWNNFQDAQKIEINQRLAELTEKVLKEKLVIVDERLLKEGVAQFSGSIRMFDLPYLQAFELIKCIQDKADPARLKEYGIALRQAYWYLPLRLLFREIDDQLYALSVQAYESAHRT